jgi:hypothetical protein
LLKKSLFRHPGEDRGPEASENLDSGFRRNDDNSAEVVFNNLLMPNDGVTNDQ